MADALRSVPSNARRMKSPIGGTLILLMLPDHFTHAPSWVWPVCWTLWAFVWLGLFFDLYRRFGMSDITDAEWSKVFPEK